NGGTSTAGIFTGDGRDLLPVQVLGASLAGKTGSALSFCGGNLSSNPLSSAGQVAYQATITDGTQGIFCYTPELRRREAFSGNWETAGSWTLGLKPASVHDVCIDPNLNLTVTGPASVTSVRSLIVGGGNGVATFSLNGGTLTTSSPVQI